MVLVYLAAVLGGGWLLCFVLAKLLEQKKDPVPFVASSPRFTIGGHRGASGEVPPNTIEAFERTVALANNALPGYGTLPEYGVLLEMDVWCSADGEIIVSHDETLSSQTNGQGLIREYSLQELKKLDAGYTFSPDGGKSFPFRGKGHTLPTLPEVLTRFQDSRISIDIKRNDPDFARSVLRCIEKHGAEERVSVGSFSSSIIALVLREFPKVCTTFSMKEAIAFVVLQKLALTGLFRPQSSVIMISEFSDTENPEYQGGRVKQGVRIITPTFIQAAHRLGIPVYAWTINERENMIRLISWGIDGIITDYPSILAEAVEENLTA